MTYSESRVKYAEVLDSVVNDREEVIITRAGHVPNVGTTTSSGTYPGVASRAAGFQDASDQTSASRQLSTCADTRSQSTSGRPLPMA